MKRKCLLTLSILFWIAYIFCCYPVIAIDHIYQPELYNEMPGYLQEFKNTVERQAREFREIFYLNFNTEEKMVALTFDDGPDSLNTPLVLDILNQENVKATFFLLGSKIEEEPEITARIMNDGHQLANHSWKHPDFRKLNINNILGDEIDPTSRLIEKLTGIYPRFIRPPYGAVNDETIKVLGEKGWKFINWSIDTFDWDENNNDPEQILGKVKKYTHPGAIILLHCDETRVSTVKALPGIINFLKDEGYEFSTVRELISSVKGLN